MEVFDSEGHKKALRRILQVFHSKAGTFENAELQRLVSAVESYETKEYRDQNTHDEE